MLEDLFYINCRDLLESTDIKNISESGGEISFSCPSADHFHGDTSPSARMNSRTTAFICHGCGKRGNAITFLAWHKSIPETVARRLLEERYGGGAISAGVGNLEDMVKKIMNPEVVEEEKRIPPNEAEWIKRFYIDWEAYGRHGAIDYMYRRNFDPIILEKWEIGFDQYSNRITIPIRDHEGKLVGFKGRAWRENTIPRYMILGDNRNQHRYGFQPYQKSKYVFGLDKIKQQCGLNEIVIVEGELNVIAMDQHGYYMTVGIAGSDFSDFQARLIIESACSSILFLDNDKAGDKGTKKVIEMLSPYMPLDVVQNATGDAAELDKETVDSLIHGAKSALESQVEGKL